jgi:F420-dependent oxidoreductase-like protein
MRIGIFGGTESATGPVDGVIDAAARAAKEGFPSFWLPQIFGMDAVTMCGVIGREVPGIELGTAVVPTFPRHPHALALQSVTSGALAGGRFTLGIGLSHQIVIEAMFGMSFEKPVRHMREYLSVLTPLLRGEPAAFQGEVYRVNAPVQIAGAPPVPVLVAALGEQMLKLTASMADGTITWMTAHKTLASHTVPTITAAAKDAGRPAPRICAGLPVCVTGDPAGARERAANVFSIYGTLPSYRAMLDREGLEGPGDAAIVGDEATVRAGIEELRDAGVTDFMAVEFSTDEAERNNTRDLLRSLL